MIGRNLIAEAEAAVANGIAFCDGKYGRAQAAVLGHALALLQEQDGGLVISCGSLGGDGGKCEQGLTIAAWVRIHECPICGRKVPNLGPTR